MEPEIALVDSYAVVLPSGTTLRFDQTLWGKVCRLDAIETPAGRYLFDDDVATARVRQLLEATTVYGQLAVPPDAPALVEIEEEIADLLARF